MTIRLNACLECGVDLVPGAREREFCASPCRMAWNNRRRDRGAELYDLYMAHRFERDEAKARGVFQAINRLASDFRREDRALRAGRRSWRRTEIVLGERPHLKAIQYRMGNAR